MTMINEAAAGEWGMGNVECGMWNVERGMGTGMGMWTWNASIARAGATHW